MLLWFAILSLLLFINVGQRSGLYCRGWLYCLTLSTINYCFELDRGGVCVDVVGYVVHHYCLIIGSCFCV